MKNKLFFVVLFVAVWLGMSAFMPMFALEVPEALVTILSGFVAFLVTQALKALGGAVGIDISGWGSFITAAIVSVLVGIANSLLGYVPLEFENVVQVVFQLLIVLFGAMGIHGTYKLVRK